MKASACLSLGAAALVAAMPVVEKRTVAVTDAGILNYALTLEHLEDKFYREGLANYTEAQFAAAGFDSTFYTNLKEISYDETTHVAFLSGALSAAGATPVAECTYSFGTTTAAGFVGLASVLEGVGVSAYLGAAAFISTKAYLTAAASILTVESRHNAYIRAALKESPFPQPFDTPLDFDEVYTLASQFIVSCPASNPAFLPLAAFPSLAASGTAASGSTIELTVSQSVTSKGKWSPPAKVYAAWAAVTGSVFVPAQSVGNGVYKTVIPAGFHGQSYVVLTDNSTDSSDTSILAGPAIVEITGTSGSP